MGTKTNLFRSKAATVLKSLLNSAFASIFKHLAVVFFEMMFQILKTAITVYSTNERSETG